MATCIGLQTFTVRRFLKSPAAIHASFETLAGMGLRAVELAYVKLEPAFIDALADAGQRHGIRFLSSQIKFDILDKRRDWMIALHEQLGCTNTAVSVLAVKAMRGNRDQLLAFCEQLESLGQWYKQRGVQLCFHHHDFEFQRYGDEVGLDLILANTDPQHLGLELDTYWAQRGGCEPAALIRRLGDRVKVVHLRDYGVTPQLISMATKDLALGAGNLDIAAIVDAAQAAGVPLLAIEQDSKHPFDSVQQSLEHLRELGYAALLEPPTLEQTP